MRRFLGSLLVVGLVIGTVSEARAAPLNVIITADNAYGFGFGDVNGMYTYFGGVRNVLASEIFSGPPVLQVSPPPSPYTIPGVGPEMYQVNATSLNDYVYIVTWSDDSVWQGVIAGFQLPSSTLVSGSAWEVFATGKDRDSNVLADTLLASDLPIINAEIATANANLGGPGTSRGWVDVNGLLPNSSPGAGALALWPGSPPSGAGFPTSITGIPAGTPWMWYNESPSTITDPFVAGLEGPDGHNEYLIFRIRLGDIPELSHELSVPEPSSIALALTGLLGLGLLARRVRRKAGPLAVGMLLLACVSAQTDAATLTLSGFTANRSTNLLQNGSFETQASGSGAFFWATGTTLAPYEQPDGWTSIGGQQAYARRHDTFASSGSAPLPHGSYGLYFGNRFNSSVSETPTFLANGRVQFTSPPTIVPDTAGSYTPAVQLWQTVTGLNPAHTYGLSFWTSGEAARFQSYPHDGVFGLEVTGFDDEYLAVPSGNGSLGDNHTYQFTFVPTSSTVTIGFTNWGHFAQGYTAGWQLPTTSELVLDDVILNDLGPRVPEPSGLALAGLASTALVVAGWRFSPAIAARHRKESACHG